MRIDSSTLSRAVGSLGISWPTGAMANQPIVVILGGDGGILYVNEAWRSFCLDEGESTDVDAWIGRDFLGLARDGQIEEGGDGMLASAALTDLLSGKRKRFEMVYGCERGGQPRWFKMLCRGVNNGGPVRAVIMLIDMTDVHLGELSLRRSEERLCSMIEGGNAREDLDGGAIDAMLAVEMRRKPQSSGTVEVGVRARLSPREKECLLWTSYGLRSKEVADRLGITTKTVEHHLAKAKHKLGSKNRVEAVTRAISLNLIQP